MNARTLVRCVGAGPQRLWRGHVAATGTSPCATWDRVRDLVQRTYSTAVRHRLAFREIRPPVMVCAPHLSNAAAQYFRSTFGDDSVTVWRAMLPFNGEDFAIFLNHMPGAMFGLGVTNAAAGFNGHPHSPAFTADEQAISRGTRAMAGWLHTRLHTLANGAPRIVSRSSPLIHRRQGLSRKRNRLRTGFPRLSSVWKGPAAVVAGVSLAARVTRGSCRSCRSCPGARRGRDAVAGALNPA